MESSNTRRKLEPLREDGSDSAYSSDSNHSMEIPPSTGNRASSQESLSISALQDQVKNLTEITDAVVEDHRNSTIRSLSGSVITAAGGITTIVGLILAPFTLGVSLIVTGLGVAVSAAGSLTKIASNIREMKEKTAHKQIESVLEELEQKLSPFTESLQGIELRLNKIPRVKPTDPTTQEEQIAYGIYRGIGYAAEAVRLGIAVELGTEEAQGSRAVIACGVITGALACIFLLMDLAFIVCYVNQLREINRERRSGNGKSSICKFIKRTKETVDHLNQTLDQLKAI